MDSSGRGRDLVVVVSLVFTGGCFWLEGPLGDTRGDAAVDAGPAPLEAQVIIGIPDEETGLGFVPLEAGGDVPLQTFGQGGTHAAVAVRCIGFGQRAFVDITIENLDTGDTVMTTPAARPTLLLCREENVCDMIPANVMTGGLADPDKKDGLPIRITADVHNEAGVMASASVEGVLRQQF